WKLPSDGSEAGNECGLLNRCANRPDAALAIDPLAQVPDQSKLFHLHAHLVLVPAQQGRGVGNRVAVDMDLR
ncbi:MAG: hypothetical protein QOI46_1817, partial [Alphaproteobacteria bacterium]|nr:hypothetical protein [Alphaproteobacteria bacterium]